MWKSVKLIKFLKCENVIHQAILGASVTISKDWELFWDL